LSVKLQNIRVEDKRPTLQHFLILMQGLTPYHDSNDKRQPGDFTGIHFQNTYTAEPSVLDEPDVLWGMPAGQITNLTFENLTIGGKEITNLNHFKHNEHVNNLRLTVRK